MICRRTESLSPIAVPSGLWVANAEFHPKEHSRDDQGMGRRQICSFALQASCPGNQSVASFRPVGSRHDWNASTNAGLTRQLHLNLFIHSRGHLEASWRHPASSPLALTDIRYYQDLAQRAEAGLFDSIFLADQLALGDDVDPIAAIHTEAIAVRAAAVTWPRSPSQSPCAETSITAPGARTARSGSRGSQ
jgi:hypothetical protein